MKKQNRKQGFTLVELLVVIAILAILATVSIVGYTAFITRAHKSNAETEASQIRDAIRAEMLIPDVDADGKEIIDLGAAGGTNYYITKVGGKYVVATLEDIPAGEGTAASKAYKATNEDLTDLFKTLNDNDLQDLFAPNHATIKANEDGTLTYTYFVNGQANDAENIKVIIDLNNLDEVSIEGE